MYIMAYIWKEEHFVNHMIEVNVRFMAVNAQTQPLLNSAKTKNSMFCWFKCNETFNFYAFSFSCFQNYHFQFKKYVPQCRLWSFYCVWKWLFFSKMRRTGQTLSTKLYIFFCKMTPPKYIYIYILACVHGEVESGILVFFNRHPGTCCSQLTNVVY